MNGNLVHVARWDDLDLGREETKVASEVAESFRALLVEASKIRVVLVAAQLIVGVAMPIGIGWSVNLATSTNSTQASFGRTAVVFLAVLQAFLVIALVLGPNTPARVIVEHERIVEGRNKFRELGRSLALVGEAFVGATVCSSLSANRAIELLQTGSAESKGDLQVELGYILDPYMDAQHRALGFGQRTGIFRITIFELSDNLVELVPVCSLREKGTTPQETKGSSRGISRRAGN